MDLRHLQYFVIVAEEMNITRAAERIGIAQPPLTRLIHHLEAEVGAQLFDRSKRQIVLTEAGKVFLERVTPLLKQYQETVRLTQRVSRGEKEQLVLGYTSSVLYSILPDLVRVHRERYPSVELVLRDLAPLSFKAMVQALYEKRIDIAFMSYPPTAEGISRENLLGCPLAVLLPASHSLAAQEAIPLAALAHEPWILCANTRKKPQPCAELLEQCREAGFEPQIVQSTNQVHALVSLVAAGIGISILPAWPRIPLDGVVCRPLQGLSLIADLQMIWSASEPTTTLQQFLQVAREVSTQALQTETSYLPA
uniref:LysR family transcriptional regulator n=1 Tax=Thermosporothrix sp. COM3 TaxID=2490863 RepID=A0A455SAD0_9CHLR|nr:LysR family transcriptional regulator [Thermosporothrix sp. COM3]